MTSAHQRVKIPFADPALQADIDTHADQFGALFRQSVYLPGGHEHGIPCFSVRSPVTVRQDVSLPTPDALKAA